MSPGDLIDLGGEIPRRCDDRASDQRWWRRQRGIDGAHPCGDPFEPLDGEVHHPVTVLESLLADGVDLDQERPAGEGPPPSPINEALAGGRERVDRGRRGGVGDVGEEGPAELVVGAEERVELVAELLVEGRPRYARRGRDVGHGRSRVAVLPHHIEDGIEDPLAL